MKGLLIKDFYVLKRGAASIIGLCVIYAAIAAFQKSNLFFVWFLGLLAGMMPMNVMGFDERSKWDTLAGTMPYTVAELVFEKYLISIIATLAAAAVFSLVNAGLMIFADMGSIEILLRNIMIIIAVGTGFAALELPFIFWLGVSKGRIIFIISVMLISIGASLFMINSVGSDGLNASVSQLEALNIRWGIAIVLILVMTAVSSFISIEIYKRKEF